MGGGVIGWFAKNGVAANLIAIIAIVGGGVSIWTIKQEVFPEFSLNLITISVPYLGAAPEEVEEGVCVRIEEAIQGLDDVKEITSVASEGVGLVTVELTTYADTREALADIKSRVDAIDTFPEETEKPVVAEVTSRRQVVNLAVFGDTDEHSLRNLAEDVRDDLLALPEISQVDLLNARPFEISVEVSETALRRHGLTFAQVADAVRRSSLDLPGGSVKTRGGEILLRTKGQAYHAPEFENLVLLTRPDGTRLLLGDVARVVDGFADTEQASRFNGKPAMLLEIFRAGKQDALRISDSVERYVAEKRTRLPAGLDISEWNDASRVLRGRRDLLVRNGSTGLVLVLLSLALFLRFRLAIWVAVGLVVAFMGTFWLMPFLDVSINVISLFAFILVLGIVVDDAIVVGESIYSRQHETGLGLAGAIEGAREVSLPVVFAVLTTVAAFIPLLNISGTTGKFMRTIPLIVIPCLLWSLMESLWVLPSHLAHYRHKTAAERRAGPWGRFQSRFSDGLRAFSQRFYSPVLELALEWRYLTVAVGIATLLLTVGLAVGGHIRFVFFPDVEADYISAALTLPPGTPVEQTSAAVSRLERAAEAVGAETERETGTNNLRHMIAAIGEHPFRRAQNQNAGGTAGREIFSNLGEVTIELLPAEERSIPSPELAARWREAVGQIPDVVELQFTSSLFSTGEDIDVRLSGKDIDELQAAAARLKGELSGFGGVFDISDSFREGKRELRLDIKPEAEVLGLTLSDLARQVRQAFYGEEAQRIQRGRHDIRVMVRYPEDERRSLDDLRNLRIRTPAGQEVPFADVAEVRSGRGYASIKRVDRRRTINVRADIDPAVAAPAAVNAELEQRLLPALMAEFPGVSWAFDGQQAEQNETMVGIAQGFTLALVLIFGLLAVPLRSYVQPLLIMAAIPFGIVGALWGHVLMGLNLTILSMFGVVALTGVVVNDSLVMVDFINRKRREGVPLVRAVREAGVSRFRPILLTSLTTFVGLSPLMLEKSMQARFLIPMAVSLAFGVIFATFVTLVLIPSGYLILDDLIPLRKKGTDPLSARPEPA